MGVDTCKTVLWASSQINSESYWYFVHYIIYIGTCCLHVTIRGLFRDIIIPWGVLISPILNIITTKNWNIMISWWNFIMISILSVRPLTSKICITIISGNLLDWWCILLDRKHSWLRWWRQWWCLRCSLLYWYWFWSTRRIWYFHRPFACSNSRWVCVEICGSCRLLLHEGTAHCIPYHITNCVHENPWLIDQCMMDSLMNSLLEHLPVTLYIFIFINFSCSKNHWQWSFLNYFVSSLAKGLLAFDSELFCWFFYNVFLLLSQLIECHIDCWFIWHLDDCVPPGVPRKCVDTKMQLMHQTHDRPGRSA